MADTGIELKGSTFTLSVLHLVDNDLSQVSDLLSAKVARAPQFFSNAPLVINVEQLDTVPDFYELRDKVEAASFVLVGITGARNSQIKDAAKAAGLAVLTGGKAPEQETAAPEETAVPDVTTPAQDNEGLIPTRVHVGNVRSGQQIYAAGGALVIIGSVGNGAEVIADDSIHIYGALRGRALAGAHGNRQARIYCQQVDPELVSIAGTYQLSDALPTDMADKHVHIRLEHDKLIFEKIQY